MSRKLSYDKTMFGAAMLILVFGLVMIYSASAMIALQKIGVDNPYHFLIRQCLWALGGGALMFGLMHVDVARLKLPVVTYSLLGGLVVLLVIVLFQAPINGTHRWIVFSRFQLQPSEFAKPVLILFLASYLSQRESRINELSAGLVPVGLVVAGVAGLIMLQPDFGTAATIVVVSASLVFVAGVSWKRLAICATAIVPAAVYLAASADYRRARLLSFMNPEADPLGKGFQAMQSLIAIGTGGMHGLGIGNGRQKLYFLPEPHTDFIFSIIGEELGFIGSLALLVVFGILVWRGLRVAKMSEDRFTFYAALGFTMMIAVQVLINVSVALCLLPTKGLPLPLVSYGGSSLLASMIAVGILLNLSQQSN